MNIAITYFVGVLTNLSPLFMLPLTHRQKTPQATVSLSPSFVYNIRDLYMSFSDAQGNKWSALFDSAEVMTTILRAIVASMAHIATHQESKTEIVIKGILPSPAGSSSDEPMLTVGMAAGMAIVQAPRIVWRIHRPSRDVV